MATVHDQFVGVADETNYGANVVPTSFFEIVSEDIAGVYERIESEALRGPVLREDRFAPNPKGAAGSVEMEVLDKGFNFWIDKLNGDGSFSLQAARYASGIDELIPFTYSGGKVAEWELSCEVDAIVKLSVTCDFASEGINTDPLASPTYPAASQLLTFIGGEVQIGGAQFPVSAITLSGSNGLKVDRYAMRGSASTAKREPKPEELKEITFELTGEFEDDTHSQRVAALAAAGTVANVNLYFDSPQGGVLDVTLPVGRFDEAPANASRTVTEQALTGKALAPADGTDAVVWTYTEAATV